MRASVKDYGTARAARHGDAIIDKPIVVNLDQDKEIVEEVQMKDKSLYGPTVDNRIPGFSDEMIQYMDAAFFACAKNGGTQYKPASTLPTIKEQVSKAIVKLSKTENRYMKGVPRSQMFIAFDPDTYDELRDEIEKVHLPNVDTSDAYLNKFRGVECEECLNLPEGVKFVILVKDYSIVNPYMVNTFALEKLELADAFGIELFFYFGMKAVVPESILWFDGTTEDPTPEPTDTVTKKSSK